MQHRRAVVFSAVPIEDEQERLKGYLREEDFVVACDAGYRNAQRFGLTPDLIIGDFDSAPPPVLEEDAERKTIVLPHVKDDTDTHFAARWLVEQGFTEAVFLGALGGKRMEHTIANLYTALFLAQNGVTPILANGDSEVHILCPGQPLILERRDWMYLSLFPMDGNLTGVELSGVFYPLRGATLHPDFPIGASNEFTEPTATLSCVGGYGLVILTRADG